jgi:hypothetical protein
VNVSRTDAGNNFIATRVAVVKYHTAPGAGRMTEFVFARTSDRT